MAHMRLQDIASFHAALGEPFRLRVLRLLMDRERCVCELMRALRWPQYGVSRHLRVLKEAGLVRDRREGKWVHYRISPALPRNLQESLACLRPLWDRSPVVRRDLRAIRASGSRARAPGAGCGGTARNARGPLEAFQEQGRKV